MKVKIYVGCTIITYYTMYVSLDRLFPDSLKDAIMNIPGFIELRGEEKYSIEFIVGIAFNEDDIKKQINIRILEYMEDTDEH